MEFKKDADCIPSSDFWYDLTNGGYFNPEDFLENEEDIQKVKEAVILLKQFKQELEDNDLIDWI
jgi:hypothetical protein